MFLLFEPILTNLLLLFIGDLIKFFEVTFIAFFDVVMGGRIVLFFPFKSAATGVIYSVGSFLTFDEALMLFLMSDNAARPLTPICGLALYGMAWEASLLGATLAVFSGFILSGAS